MGTWLKRVVRGQYAVLFAAALLSVITDNAEAVPAFARQTGLA